MIPDYEISKSIEHVIKSKIGRIFVNEKILEEYSVKIYEIDPYFYEHYKKKIQVDNNDQEYILFGIDNYFTEYFLAVEIDGKGHTDRDLIFEEKRQNTLEKKLNCTFIRINTSKENYDADYEASRIQTFISNFNKNKIKQLEDKIKNLSVKNNVNNKFKIIIIIIIIHSYYKKCIFILKNVKNIQVAHFQKN